MNEARSKAEHTGGGLENHRRRARHVHALHYDLQVATETFNSVDHGSDAGQRVAVTHPEHNPLQEGSVLLRSGTLTPPSVRLNLKTYWRDWQLIENSGGQVLDRGFRRTGWNFFFLPDRSVGTQLEAAEIAASGERC